MSGHHGRNGDWYINGRPRPYQGSRVTRRDPNYRPGNGTPYQGPQYPRAAQPGDVGGYVWPNFNAGRNMNPRWWGSTIPLGVHGMTDRGPRANDLGWYEDLEQGRDEYGLDTAEATPEQEARLARQARELASVERELEEIRREEQRRDERLSTIAREQREGQRRSSPGIGSSAMGSGSRSYAPAPLRYSPAPGLSAMGSGCRYSPAPGPSNLGPGRSYAPPALRYSPPPRQYTSLMRTGSAAPRPSSRAPRPPSRAPRPSSQAPRPYSPPRHGYSSSRRPSSTMGRSRAPSIQYDPLPRQGDSRRSHRDFYDAERGSRDYRDGGRGDGSGRWRPY